MDDITGTGYEHEITINLDGEWKDWWPRWSAFLQDRLVAGFKVYGDRSLEEDPTRLLDMIAEEAADLANWSGILWIRTRKLKAKLDKLNAMRAPRA